MLDIETRAGQAGAMWQQGEAALQAGNPALAYDLFTLAHDLVTDCPRLHELAHRKLRTVTRRHRDKREFITDSVLLALAPLGIFRLIALYFRSRVGGSELCRGRA